jgi:serine protease Do/serine protease DegQ
MVDHRLAGARFEELPLKQRSDRVKGALLSELEPDSVLARRGLRPGDIITGCNRMKIQDLGEFKDVVSSIRGSLYLEVRRDGGDYVVRVD